MIKGEFALLDRQLDARVVQLTREAEAEVEEKFAAQLKEARKAEDKVKSELRKLEIKFNDLAETYKTKGIEPDMSKEYNYDIGKYEYKIVHFQNKAHWKPVGLKKAKELARQQVQNQLAEAKLSLARKEQDMYNELSLNALVSAEAKAFVASVPKATELFSLDRPRLEQTIATITAIK